VISAHSSLLPTGILPRSLCAALVSFFVLVVAPASASAAGPALGVRVTTPDTISAGGKVPVKITATNVGDQPWTGEIEFTNTLPAGLTFVQFETGGNCEVGGQVVSCKQEVEGVLPGGTARMSFQAAVDSGASGTLVNTVVVSGAGTGEERTSEQAMRVSLPDPLAVKTFHVAVKDQAGALFDLGGGHPAEISTTLEIPSFSRTLNQFFPPTNAPVENFKDVAVHVPPGLIGVPPATPRCTAAQLAAPNPDSFVTIPSCPEQSQVGLATILGGEVTPVYSLFPPPGSPAAFGFLFQGVVVSLVAQLRPKDNGVDLISRNTSTSVPIPAVDLDLWGFPADSSHDYVRHNCLINYHGNNGQICPSDGSDAPFLRLPTSCPGTPLPWEVELNSYLHPTQYVRKQTTTPPVTGCESLPFDPAITLVPTSSVANSPTGLNVTLTMPQHSSPEGSEADLKDASVTLPEGMTLNPSSAGGLQACDDAQLRLGQAGASECPDASKIGGVSLKTPLLDEEVGGSIFLRSQNSNDPASGQMFRIVVELRNDERGVHIKLPAALKSDPATGRLTTIFEDNPQLPFSELQLHFKVGPRAPLTTPRSCGTARGQAVLAPWSGTAPKTMSPEMSFNQGCDVKPLVPGFDAGTVMPIAGRTSPLVLRLQRSDDQPDLERFEVNLPPGVAAVLKGVPYCPPAALEAAVGKTGRSEQAAPSCPAASRIGSVDAASGVGPTPVHVQGTVYLTGPYKGAPLGVATVIPAIAGPFDLGTIVVRSALFVDPSDVHTRIVSDPLPQVFGGIVLHTRSIEINVDRPDFTLNPTSCAEKSVNGTAFGLGGSFAALVQRFQVGSCERLAFKPKLSLHLRGETRRAGFPGLTAVLKMPANGANIARASVALPGSEFLAQSHLGTICTRVQYAAEGGGGAGCPKGSVYGRATALSPLLDKPLSGPVYLRSNGGERELPDLVAALDGQIHVDLVGYIDSDKKTDGLRTTFAHVPDAPVSKFVMRLPAGRKSLLENHRNLCRSTNRAKVNLIAHSGKRSKTRPELKIPCGKKQHGKKLGNRSR